MKTAKDFHFAFGHIGIWFKTAEEAEQAMKFLADHFGFDVDPTSFGWNIDHNHIELIRGPGRGTKGHFSILCDDIEGAKEYLESKGVVFLENAQYSVDGKLWKLWARDEISGFAWHLALRGKANEGR